MAESSHDLSVTELTNAGNTDQHSESRRIWKRFTSTNTLISEM